jgi:hypothetical protein
MVPETLYETVCPNCSKTFELRGDQTEGVCPHCKAFLRFLPEDAAAPSTPEAAPQPSKGSAPVAEAKLPEPRVGEFRIQCPSCDKPLNVAADASETTCVHCQTELSLEDVYADRGIEYPVLCPSCTQLHEVPLMREHGQCPNCQTFLAYENTYPTFDAVQTPVANGATAPPAEAAPSTPPISAKAVPAKESRPTPEPSPSSMNGAGPVVTGESGPLPFPVTCPSCKAAFGVAAGTKEGNCPQCNVPLAFVTEKEQQALAEAEERKKAFQAKMAARRQAEKEKVAAALKAKEEKLAAKKAKEEAAANLAPVVPPAPPKPSPIEEKAAAKVAAPEKPSPPVKEVAKKPAPAPEPASPIAPAPAPAGEKKSRFGVFGRSKKPDEAGPIPAPIEVEMAPISAPPPAPKGKKEKPVETAALAEFTMDVQLDAPASAPLPKPKPKKGKEAPASSPIEISSDIEVVAAAPTKGKTTATPPPSALDLGGMDIQIDAAPPAAPTNEKKGFLGRFRRTKSAPEAAPTVADIAIDMPASPAKPEAQKKGKASPATIEMGSIDLMSESAPAAPPSKKGKGAPPPATATVDMGEIMIESAPAAPAPKKGKGKAEPAPAATIDMGEISIESAPAPEAEISIDLGGEPASTPKKKGKR